MYNFIVFWQKCIDVSSVIRLLFTWRVAHKIYPAKYFLWNNSKVTSFAIALLLLGYAPFNNGCWTWKKRFIAFMFLLQFLIQYIAYSFKRMSAVLSWEDLFHATVYVFKSISTLLFLFIITIGLHTGMMRIFNFKSWLRDVHLLGFYDKVNKRLNKESNICGYLVHYILCEKNSYAFKIPLTLMSNRTQIRINIKGFLGWYIFNSIIQLLLWVRF